VKIQNGLKNELACVVRTDLEGVEALAQFIMALVRKGGPSVTAQFFENYLSMNKPFIRIGRDEILEFDLIANAASENIERFENQTFISPTQSNPVFSDLEAMTANPTAKDIQVLDDWKVDFSYKKIAGIRRLAAAGATDLIDTGLAFFAFGQSSLVSSGVFDLKRAGDRIFVTGQVTHVFTDADGYNFNPGKFFHAESQVLERHKKARPFTWEAEWSELVDGEIRIGHALPRGPVQGLRRHWVRFETRPGP
jgi:hypothetical protein